MRFRTGQSGNPNGRPKGSRNTFSIIDLEDAIRVVEKKKRRKLLRHYVEQAYEDNNVLNALMKKLVPDLQRSFIEGAGIKSMVQIYLPGESVGNRIPTLATSAKTGKIPKPS